MFKGNNVYKLVALLIILVATYFVLDLTDKKGRSASFKESLVEINPENVNRLVISKGTLERELKKDDTGWKVTIDNGEQKSVTEGTVERMLQSLSEIKPGRLAANKEEKWKEYGVDSTATSVEVYEGDQKTLGIVLGRLGVQGQNKFFSYVRLEDEKEVYTADNFMTASFSVDASKYRDKALLRFEKDSLQSIVFEYPGDSSFSIDKSLSGVWVIEGNEVDSTKMTQYLNSIRFLNGSTFDDSFKPEEKEPVYSVLLNVKGTDNLVIDAYNTDSEFLRFTSSLNKEGIFTDSGNTIKEKLLKTRNYFLTP